MSCAWSQPSTGSSFKMPTAICSFGNGTPNRRNFPSSVRSMKHSERSLPKTQEPTIRSVSTCAVNSCVASLTASSTTSGAAVVTGANVAGAQGSFSRYTAFRLFAPQ